MDAIEKLRSQPGFSQYPNLLESNNDNEKSGFFIDAYGLDTVYWQDGFRVL